MLLRGDYRSVRLPSKGFACERAAVHIEAFLLNYAGHLPSGKKLGA